MDDALQPSATFKDRRGGLIAFGVFQLLIAAVLFLFAAFMLLIPTAALAKSQPPGTPPPPLAMASAMYGVFGAVFAALGVGSILAKNWARIGTLVVSWFWLSTGVLSTVVMAILMPAISKNLPPTQRQPADLGHIVNIVLIVGSLFGIVLPGCFLLFYHSKNVKATVLQGRPANAPQRPILMTILISCFGIGTVFILFSTLSKYPALFFGIILWGWKGKLVLVIYAAIYGFAAWAYAKADVRGWWAILVMQAVGLASFIVTFAGHDITDVYRRMGMTEQQLVLFKNAPLLHGFVIFTAVFWVIFLGLIIFSKGYFPAATPPVRAEPV